MNLLIFAAGIALAIVAARPSLSNGVRQAAAVALIALMFAAPTVSPNTAPLFDALTAMCIAYGWNVIGGYTGYAAFGNVAYLGLGAFVAGGFMSRQSGHLNLPWFVGIPLSVVIVALVAGLIGLVVLRLRGHYFAIATLGVSVAMPQIVSFDLLFGPRGPIPNFFGGGLPLNFPLVQDQTIFGIEFHADRLMYYLGLATALIGLLLTYWISRSKFGYSLVAIRENEEAAGVMGIDTTRSKVLAYMLSAALAALGGSVIGYRLTNMTTEAEALFSTTNNLQMIIICLIGGVGTVWGPWIGAFVLFGIQEVLRQTAGGLLEWQAVMFSLIIILVVLFLPRGLMQFVRSRAGVTWRLLVSNVAEHRV